MPASFDSATDCATNPGRRTPFAVALEPKELGGPISIISKTCLQ
jgi:hypothetical protein